MLGAAVFHVEHAEEIAIAIHYAQHRQTEAMGMFHVEHEQKKPNLRNEWEGGFEQVREWLGAEGRDYPAANLFSLHRYCSLLYSASGHTNLISANDRADLAVRHILPSLLMATPLQMVPKKVVLDFGSGAGIPGIPLKILHPESRFILVESRRKRASFLREVVRQLKLTAVEVCNQRIEDLQEMLYEGVDVVVTRAVSNLRSLMPWIDPVLKPHGTVIATLDQTRGLNQSVAVLTRCKGEALGQTHWFGLIR